MTRAWAEIQTRLDALAAQSQGRKPELVSVSYDPSPGESIIEELPEQPKSSRPKEVEVTVRLRAVYVLK